MGKRDAQGGSARAGGRRGDGVLTAIYPISTCMHDHMYVCIYMHLHRHPPPDTGPRVVTGLDVYISTGAVLRTPLAGGRSREPAMGSAVPPVEVPGAISHCGTGQLAVGPAVPGPGSGHAWFRYPHA